MPTESVPARILRRLADDVDADLVDRINIDYMTEGPVYHEGHLYGTRVTPEHMVAKLEVHYKPVTTE